MAALPTAPPQASSTQTDEQKRLVGRVTGRFNQADQGVHRRYRDKANHMYSLYRNYTEWRSQLPVDRRDRDLGLQDAQQTWGAELFIPYAFSTVETILPRMLSNAPKILVQPRARESEQNVENIKYIIEAQQEQIDYELILQEIARMGLITGLGVQKVFWKTDLRTKKTVKPRTLKLPGMSDYVIDEQQYTAFDDPMVECVDPFDFYWDPMADRMANCEWAVHRTWRSNDYCKKMLKAGTWSGITEDQITQGPGGSAKFTEAYQQRMSIGGYPNFKASDVHEVWEYHDGSEVVTILDRQWVVQQGPNPAWHGELPFQVFRPTKVSGHMAGIGEIEPIQDLQLEINTLRSQRRDNATVVLQKSFFYTEGFVDPQDFKVGPGRGVPVLGDPRESIMPVEFGEIPNSGYQEERQLQADIERTTGIDDSLSGGGGTGQTATGVQLVQAAANLRIQQKTRNCEVELVRSGGRQFLALNQQRILRNRDVRVPSEPTPDEPDRRWSWLQVGPNELAGEFDIDIEGGSMAPENVPQDRQDAQNMMAMMGSEQVGQYIDPAQAVAYILRKSGVKDPSTMIVNPEQKVPQGVVDRFKQALSGGQVDPQLIARAWAAATGPSPQGSA